MTRGRCPGLWSYYEFFSTLDEDGDEDEKGEWKVFAKKDEAIDYLYKHFIPGTVNFIDYLYHFFISTGVRVNRTFFQFFFRKNDLYANFKKRAIFISQKCAIYPHPL